MIRPVNMVENIINASGLNVDDIFTDEIPEENLKNDDLNRTQILITEARSTPATWGNGTFYDLDVAIDIQIFYSVDFNEDMTIFEVKLMKFFEKNGWRIADSQPHYPDISSSSEVHQIIKNMTITKNIGIED